MRRVNYFVLYRYIIISNMYTARRQREKEKLRERERGSSCVCVCVCNREMIYKTRRGMWDGAKDLVQ